MVRLTYIWLTDRCDYQRVKCIVITWQLVFGCVTRCLQAHQWKAGRQSDKLSYRCYKKAAAQCVWGRDSRISSSCVAIFEWQTWRIVAYSTQTAFWYIFVTSSVNSWWTVDCLETVTEQWTTIVYIHCQLKNTPKWFLIHSLQKLTDLIKSGAYCPEQICHTEM